MWRDNKQFFQGTSELSPNSVGIGGRVDVVLLTESVGETGIQHYSVDLNGHNMVGKVEVEQQLAGWKNTHKIGEITANLAGGLTEWEVDVTEGTVVKTIVTLRRGDPARTPPAAWPIEFDVDSQEVPGTTQFECDLPGTVEPPKRSVGSATTTLTTNRARRTV